MLTVFFYGSIILNNIKKGIDGDIRIYVIVHSEPDLVKAGNNICTLITPELLNRNSLFYSR